MSRKQAIQILYTLINSGILSEELENELTDLVNVICHGEFDDCEYSPRCEDCEHLGS